MSYHSFIHSKMQVALTSNGTHSYILNLGLFLTRWIMFNFTRNAPNDPSHMDHLYDSCQILSSITIKNRLSFVFHRRALYGLSDSYPFNMLFAGMRKWLYMYYLCCCEPCVCVCVCVCVSLRGVSCVWTACGLFKQPPSWSEGKYFNKLLNV